MGGAEGEASWGSTRKGKRVESRARLGEADEQEASDPVRREPLEAESPDACTRRLLRSGVGARVDGTIGGPDSESNEACPDPVRHPGGNCVRSLLLEESDA